MKIAEAQWRKIEEESGEDLLLSTGFLIIGTENEEYKRYEATATSDVERLNSEQIRERWPNLTIPDGMSGMYDTKGGTVHTKKSLQVFKKLSEKNGARL